MRKIINIIIALVFVSLSGCGKISVDPFENIEYELSGFDKTGELEYNVALPEKYNYSNSEDYEKVIMLFEYGSFTADKVDYLSNGDLVKISFDVDKELLKNQNIKLDNKEYIIKVENLKKGFVDKDDLSSSDYENITIMAKDAINEYYKSYDASIFLTEDIHVGQYIYYMDTLKSYVVVDTFYGTYDGKMIRSYIGLNNVITAVQFKNDEPVFQTLQVAYANKEFKDSFLAYGLEYTFNTPITDDTYIYISDKYSIDNSGTINKIDERAYFNDVNEVTFIKCNNYKALNDIEVLNKESYNMFKNKFDEMMNNAPKVDEYEYLDSKVQNGNLYFIYKTPGSTFFEYNEHGWTRIHIYVVEHIVVDDNGDIVSYVLTPEYYGKNSEIKYYDYSAEDIGNNYKQFE